METQRWIQTALELGFSEAAPLQPRMLQPRQDVRDMCAADRCRAYGKNWTCPPYCGSLEACAERMHRYTAGILVQTVGITEKSIDTKAYRRTEEKHLELFGKLSELIRRYDPGALCLGAGGCRICSVCAWPEPCRFPENAHASMEGYGLFVTDVCRNCGLPYHHGDHTITYSACVLFGAGGAEKPL